MYYSTEQYRLATEDEHDWDFVVCRRGAMFRLIEIRAKFTFWVSFHLTTEVKIHTSYLAFHKE